MKNFKNLTGYNSNKYVEVNHVFIKGEGTFYETKELANKNNKKTGNEVGLKYEIIKHEGVNIYKQLSSNAWN